MTKIKVLLALLALGGLMNSVEAATKAEENDLARENAELRQRVAELEGKVKALEDQIIKERRQRPPRPFRMEPPEMAPKAPDAPDLQRPAPAPPRFRFVPPQELRPAPLPPPLPKREPFIVPTPPGDRRGWKEMPFDGGSYYLIPVERMGS